MAMELSAESRESFGKALKALRTGGLIPAELYGHGTENVHLAVRAKEFAKVFRAAGENTLINLVMSGTKRPVMIHDISLDPRTDDVLSVDFYQVRLDERIKVKVPVHFKGEAPAVKEKGGVLVKALKEIEIEALPAEIPHTIEADLGRIVEIGGSFYAKDIAIPRGVKVLTNGDTAVATVTEKLKEEEVAAAPEASVESVKVETEERKAERSAKKETPETVKSEPHAKK